MQPEEGERERESGTVPIVTHFVHLPRKTGKEFKFQTYIRLNSLDNFLKYQRHPLKFLSHLLCFGVIIISFSFHAYLPYMSDHLSHIWWLKGTFNHSPSNFFFFGTSNLILIELITKLSIEKSSQLHKVNAVYIHEEGMTSDRTKWANSMSSPKFDKLSL